MSELPQTEDPHQVAEATHLAPHGVPSNAIPRALSSSRLHELANQDAGYGATYQTSGGNLAVPGANGGEAPVVFNGSDERARLRYIAAAEATDVVALREARTLTRVTINSGVFPR